MVIAIILKMDGKPMTTTLVATTSNVKALCTYPQISQSVVISHNYPLSKDTRKISLLVYTRIKIVEIGGYKYKVFQWGIIQVLFSLSYQRHPQK
ncbi:hypothetical protein C5167_037436 [Papaver somniferum]|uniref:Uncharacterized protein n=1 Tax=Papaver somniferum TaxID=3469 RepID=A0A4Y7I6P4_PAPSO|nr:hypothetical protein C5167_037436 [Papaver somniferum]